MPTSAPIRKIYSPLERVGETHKSLLYISFQGTGKYKLMVRSWLLKGLEVRGERGTGGG